MTPEEQELANDLNKMNTLEAVSFLNDTDTVASEIGDGSGLGSKLQEVKDKFNLLEGDTAKVVLDAVTTHIIKPSGNPGGSPNG